MAYEVTPGYSGTIVTKPTVTRRSGRILKGCIGAQVSPAISTLSSCLLHSNLISVHFRPPRAISRQLLTRRASAVASPGSKATSASARGRLPMVLHLLVATAAVTSSRLFRCNFIGISGRTTYDIVHLHFCCRTKSSGLCMPNWRTTCTCSGPSVDEYTVLYCNVITCNHS